MVITLTGENGLALQNELQQLTAGFVAEHGDLAIERLDGEEAEFARLSEALTSLPFLASKKLVLLRHPGANKQFTEQVEELLGNVPETTDVLIIEPKLDKRGGYYKYLQKQTEFKEFKELDLNGLAQWLVGKAKEQGGSISSSDARYLVERVGLNQQLVGNELAKLVLFEPKVTRQTIDLLTEATPQSTIFQLLEAAFGGNLKRAMQLYDEQRALKVEPQQIISMLAWQLHILALVKTAGERSGAQIASEAKVSPYVVQKTQVIARKLNLTDVKKLVHDLLVIDARLKREPIDADEALKNYLLALATR
ncbi:MAG TPA: DNA polymerase III subunit delta [Chroococcales cyanobacterium]